MSDAVVLVLWDVDHTLIDNAGVSKEIYAGAFELLTGQPSSHLPVTDGRTDFEILANLCVANGVAAPAFGDETALEALTRSAIEKALALAQRGAALPGARRALEALSGVPGVHQSVLTGNIVANARVKLSAFDLDQFIDFESGGFGSDDQRRANLVGQAQARAGAKYGRVFHEGNTVLVGDTVRDVRAGRDGGARVVGVATGKDPEAGLMAAGAHAVLPNLGSTADVIETILRVAGHQGSSAGSW